MRRLSRPRQIAIILLALCLTLPLCGCMKRNQISGNLFVQVIGIDVQDGEYFLSCNVFDASEMSGSAAEHSAGAYNVVNSSGSSISEALNEINSHFPKTINLTRNRVVVLSENAMREALKDIVCFYGRYYDTRITVHVYGFLGDVNDAVTSGIHNSTDPSRAFENIDSYATEAGLMNPSNGLIVSSGLYDEHGAFTIPLLKKRESDPALNEEKGKNDSLELAGTAVFNSKGFVCYVSPEVSAAMALLQNEKGRPVHVVEVPGMGKFSIDTPGRSNKWSAGVVGGKPVLRIKMEVSGYLTEVSGEPMTLYEDKVERVSAAYSELLKERCELALTALLHEHGSDVFGFYRKLARADSDYWNSLSQPWAEVLKDIEYDVEVDAKVTRIGQLYKVR